MIFQEGGRWRSEPSIDESRKELEELLDKLTPEERAAVQHVLDEIDTQGSSSIADECTELEWEETPLPIREWLDSYHHVGDLKDSIYPVLKQDMIELFEGNYHEVILTGCIDKQALVQCSDGSMPTLGSLIGRKTRVVTIHETDGIGHHDTSAGSDSGVKKVLELTLRNGMRVKLTPDHRVLTHRGWVRADQLDVEADYVLRPRKITYRPSNFSLQDEEAKLLAYMVTDGSSSDTWARYCDGREETGREVISSLRALGYNATTDEPYSKNGAWEVYVAKFATSGFRDWLQRMGIFKVGCREAEVPDAICRAPRRQVALFLNRVWAAEGTVAYRKTSQPRFQLAMTSERFIQQVQLLLLRWGIQSRYREYQATRKGTITTGYCLQVSGKHNIELFVRHIGTIFLKEYETGQVLERVNVTIGNTNVDVVPWTWGEARDLLREHQLPLGDWQRLSGGADSSRRNRRFSRNMFSSFCEDFESVATAEALPERFPDSVAYEQIKTLKEVDHPVCVADIGVPGPKRFTANGIAVHNSTRWG